MRPSHTSRIGTTRLGSSRSCTSNSMLHTCGGRLGRRLVRVSVSSVGSWTRRHSRIRPPTTAPDRHPAVEPVGERGDLVGVEGGRQPRVGRGERPKPGLVHGAPAPTRRDQLDSGLDEAGAHELVDRGGQVCGDCALTVERWIGDQRRDHRLVRGGGQRPPPRASPTVIVDRDAGHEPSGQHEDARQIVDRVDSTSVDRVRACGGAGHTEIMTALRATADASLGAGPSDA